VIAEIMGWEEEYVAKIIRRYVGRSASHEGNPSGSSIRPERKRDKTCKTGSKTGEANRC
jgi:hypothetical protein